MGYTIEKNVQVIIALLKFHGIRKVVVSPGSTNVCLVASLQQDDFFELYSCVDERSAAYMAVGMAAESGEIIVLTCTEATASRNYLPGMTEAFYRKIPILAITSSKPHSLIGQNVPQVIDRSSLLNDVVKKTLFFPFVRNNYEMEEYAVRVNEVILELTKDGGGPAHIEYETAYSTDYGVKELPNIQGIRRITSKDVFPALPQGRIGIYIGAHLRWSDSLTESVEAFCEKYGAVVLTDFIGNYRGKFGVDFTIITSQYRNFYDCCDLDLIIYIGDVSTTYRKNWNIKNSWRVNRDGIVRNALGHLSHVFQMDEAGFFKKYVETDREFFDTDSFSAYEEWQNIYQNLMAKVPELPFSNLWVAQQTIPLLPEKSRLFLGIENTLRSWNFFRDGHCMDGAFCNTGGYGIDGGVSSLIGASLTNQENLYFGITGDLAFFYDMNIMGNRHVGKNVRLMIINNGIGQQFKNPGYAASALGDSADEFVAAKGHFGNRSPMLVKHYAEDLGFTYLCASTKEEFWEKIGIFTGVSGGGNGSFHCFRGVYRYAG